MSQQNTPREVTIISRYTIKISGTFNGVFYKAGSVILLVENSEGIRYFVTLRRNRVHSCECKAHTEGHHQCYHITYCKAVENARAAREVAKLKQEVEAICAEVEADLTSAEPGHEPQPTPIYSNHTREEAA